MGRSGIAVAMAAARRGAKVTLYDEKMVETPAQIEQVEALQAAGVQVVPGWHGRFEEPDFDALVTSPGFKRTHPALVDCTEAGVQILSEVEFAYLISEAPIVGVTGTNGKSTTVVMTWLIAKTCADAVLCGNLSGSGYPELTLTEAADQSTPEQILVAEISSFQLEWVTEFRPDVAAITNITPDHLDRHPNFEDYQLTKLRIFKAQEPGDVAVVNQSDPGLAADRMLDAIPGGVGVTWIGREGSDPTPSSAFGERTLHLSGIGEVALADLPLYGRHNAINAVMAWELATDALGDRANPTAMLDGLRSFKGLSNRMERLGEHQGVTIVNNSMCTNPSAVIANANAIPGVQYVLMGGVTKGLDFSEVQIFFANSPHKIYLFGPKLEHGLHEQLGELGTAYATLEEAFVAAMRAAKDGETVLLSPGCASAPPYANFRERGDAFRDLVARWLREQQG